jgi:hypothetical protein
MQNIKRKSVILLLAFSLIFIPLSSASPTQEPSTCTFIDGFLDLFRSPNCGENYIKPSLLISSGETKPTIIKYTGEERNNFIPLISNNQVCFYYKEGTEAKTVDELKDILQQTKSSVPDWQVGIRYIVNDLVTYNNLIYKVLQEHTSQSDWTPDKVPALFSFYAFQDLGEVPNWIQPLGSHDAYKLNDRVFYEGYIYESWINNNVWSPLVYGWTQIGLLYVSNSTTNSPSNLTIQTELDTTLVLPRTTEGDLNKFCTDIRDKIQIGTNTLIIENQTTMSVVYSPFDTFNITATIYRDVLHDGNYSNAVNDVFVFVEQNKFGANWSSDNTTWEKFKYEIKTDLNIVHYRQNEFDFLNGINKHRLNLDDICYEGANCSFQINQKDNEYILEVYFYNKDGFIDPSYTIIPISGNIYNNTRFESSTNIHLEINDTAERFASFDGVNDYFNLPDLSVGETGRDLTYSVWFNSKNFTGNLDIFGQVNSPSNVGYIRMQIRGTQFGGIAQNSSSALNSFVGTTLTANTWYYGVLTKTGNNISFYLNGVYEGSIINISDSYGFNKATIGAWYDGTSNAFNGSIDEAMVFNKVLTQDEIINIYNLNRTSYNGSTNGLVGYWNFNNRYNNGDDSSGNGNNGVFTNGAYTEIYDSSFTQFDNSNVNLLATNLVAYYSFDADTSTTSYDLTNNNFDGTYTGNAYSGDGLFEKSLILDGDGDYIELGSPIPTGLRITQPISISAWINTKDTNKDQTILCSSDTNFQNIIYCVRVLGGNIYVQHAVSNSFGRFQTNSVPISQNDTWYHVTIVRNSTTSPYGVVYVDGQQVAVTQVGTTAVSYSGGQALRIGRLGLFTGNAEFFNGSIDEVMIFSKALNETEVLDIYNNQSDRFKSEGIVGLNPASDGNAYNFINLTINFTNLFNTNTSARFGYWKESFGYNVSGDITNNLRSYYQADGNANDYFGINNGNLVNGSNASEFGIYANSFTFDGVNDYVNVSSTFVVNVSTDYTMAGWVKSNNQNQNGCFFYVRTVGVCQGGTTAGENTGNRIRTIHDGVAWDVSTSTINSEWNHIVLTRSGTSNFLYLNGVLIMTTTRTPYILADFGTKIGSAENVRFFNGQVDEVMFFNSSLNVDQIKQIYNLGLAEWEYSDWETIQSGVEAHLPINNGSIYATTFRPEIRLESSDGFYTPYLISNVTLSPLTIPIQISFLDGTSNGTQNEGQTYIISNVSHLYSLNVTTNLYWDNGTLHTSISNSTNPAINIFSSLPFGTYYLNATAFADDGTNASTGTNEIILTPDNTNPLIQFVNPTDTSGSFKTGNLIANVSAFDINPDKVTLLINYSNGTLYYENISNYGNNFYSVNVPDGLWYFQALANDTWGNTNETEIRNVTIDSSAPTLNLITPLQNNLYESLFVPLNFTTFDSSGIDEIWYNIIYSSEGTNSTYISNTTITGNTNIPINIIGSFYINLFANDTLGNLASVLNRFFHVTNLTTPYVYPCTGNEVLLGNGTCVPINQTGGSSQLLETFGYGKTRY